MHSTFLQFVAKDLRSRFGGNFSDITIVFPNKRASLFFDPILFGDNVCPQWCPEYISIKELFDALSPFRKADDLELLSILYDVWCNCTDRVESFDVFLPWGEVLLSDFDDIDKHLSSASRIFRNVSDLHELDSLDYLSDEQKVRIASFFHEFAVENDSRLRANFLNIWNRLFLVYDRFRSRLMSAGIGYDGLIARSVVEGLERTFVEGSENVREEKGDFLKEEKLKKGRFVFIGFNFLHDSELHLMKWLKNECDALFYWDYDEWYMKDGHEAGTFIRENILLLGNALSDNSKSEECLGLYDNLQIEDKDITIVNANTENVLTRYIGDWLKSLDGHFSNYPPNTAIVLCNENLLPAVLHGIPSDVGSVNITLGYGLWNTPVSSFLQSLLLFYVHGSIDNSSRVRMKYVMPILSHSLCQRVTCNASILAKHIEQDNGIFPHREMLCVDDYLSLIFSHEKEEEKEKLIDNGQNPNSEEGTLHQLSSWLRSVIAYTAHHIAYDGNDDALTNESLYRLYTLLTRLDNLIVDGKLSVNVHTYENLLRELTARTSVPFHGEPATGLQVMGMLETRCLDFENVLVLSCGEQYIPKKSSNSSFIPPLLRHAYGLTTHVHREGVQSYYFFRLLQRAKHITLAYCDTVDGIGSGEPSRYILQLLTETSHRIKRVSISSDVTLTPFVKNDLPKTEAMLDILRNKSHYSPTSINSYLNCGRRFFYEYIIGIRELDEINEDNIDRRIFGTLFHRVSEMLYSSFLESHSPVTHDYLNNLASHSEVLTRLIDDAMQEMLEGKGNERGEKRFTTDNKDSSTGTQHPKEKVPYHGTLLVIRCVLLKYLQQLIKTDVQHTPFYILGLEKIVDAPMTFELNGKNYTINIKGTVDRIDAYFDTDDTIQIRIIDYKTGKPDERNNYKIEDIFDHERDGHGKGYRLQSCIYSLIVRQWIDEGKLSLKEYIPSATKEQCADAHIAPALLYIRNYNNDNNNPILMFKRAPLTDIKSAIGSLKKGLHDLFKQMFDIDIPLSATKDTQLCNICHCKKICKFDNQE